MPRRRKILIADDDPSIREILSIQLARMGYEVILADNGTEAVAAYKKEEPDLIILDVMMPQTNGLQACQDIRALESPNTRVPILFLTARESTKDKSSAALSGGDGFIVKPVSLEELRQQLETALRKDGNS
jgi:two-component system OmpR family response regulator